MLHYGLSWCVLSFVGAMASTDTTVSPKHGPDPALIERAWIVTELVLDRHVEPPARQAMVLAGVKKVLNLAHQPVPQELGRRASGITTREQFGALLGEVWPPPGPKTGPAMDLDGALIEGLLAPVAGRPQVQEAPSTKIEDQLLGNRYVGTGIQIQMLAGEKVPQILNPFRRGGARRAGSRPGDLIVAVDGRDTKGVPLGKVVEWLRGEAGTQVVVDVRQPDAPAVRRLRVTRGEVMIDTVLGYRRASEDAWKYLADPAGVGYLRVRGITSSTLHELRQAEARLRADGARALILDLRSGGAAGGGRLSDGVLVADGLLDRGLMFRTRDAHGTVKDFRAQADCLFRDWPLAVLTDKEVADDVVQMIVAALQDNKRATVVGEATKADGKVRSGLPLPGGQSLLVLWTTRLERAINGRAWAAEPDEVVRLDKTQRQAVSAWLNEKELSELPAGKSDEPPQDPQLAKALELLRTALKKGDSAARP